MMLPGIELMYTTEQLCAQFFFKAQISPGLARHGVSNCSGGIFSTINDLSHRDHLRHVCFDPRVSPITSLLTLQVG